LPEDASAGRTQVSTDTRLSQSQVAIFHNTNSPNWPNQAVFRLAGKHALYGEFEAMIDIRTGAVSGRLPKRALAHVQEWRRLHESELLSAWDLARAELPLPRIEPLE
jgi:hypothetical protein